MTPEKIGGDEGTVLDATLPGTSSMLADKIVRSQDGMLLTAIGVRMRGTVAGQILAFEAINDDSLPVKLCGLLGIDGLRLVRFSDAPELTDT
uniref:Uncharacterized protein n=1 Tax=Parascaris univalens TaxID=6257 RepID=A0A914ZGF5_PARUN